MKTITIKSAGLFLTFGFSLITLNCFSQESKLSRHEQAEVRKAELNLNYLVPDTLLQTRKFVLEADYLNNQYGNRIHVILMLNFIKLDSSTAVFN